MKHAMNLSLVIPFLLANLNFQSVNNSFIDDNLKLKATLVAQQTCGMKLLSELQSKFPLRTLVNDGYSNFSVIGYSPSFGAVQVMPVNRQGEQLGFTADWRCADVLSIGTI